MGATVLKGAVLTPAPKPYLPNEAKVWYVSDTSASDDQTGNDYDRPVRRISNPTNTYGKIRTDTGASRYRADIVYVGKGYYDENVRVISCDYTRIIGAGMGIANVRPANVLGTQNTDALGNSQAITLTNQTTLQSFWGFIVGSRGVEITGFTIHGAGGSSSNGGQGGIFIGDGGAISSANNWGSSQSHIHHIYFEGGEMTVGGWAICFAGFGGGVVVEDNVMHRWRSGGILVNGGGTRNTVGATVRRNQIIACRGYGIRRSDGGATGSGGCHYVDNWISEDNTAMTNGILLGASPVAGDLVAGNHIGTANAPISATAALDRISGNYTSTAGNVAATYVSMA